jgi:hypothetical protein
MNAAAGIRTSHAMLISQPCTCAWLLKNKQQQQ